MFQIISNIVIMKYAVRKSIMLLALSLCAANMFALSDKAEWIRCERNADRALPMLRKVITLGKVPSKAVVEATALGIYDITVNGQQVSQHELKPGWTDYRKEVTYQTIDITKALRKGKTSSSCSSAQGGGQIPSAGMHTEKTSLSISRRR